jgi:cell division septation protein DedD
MFELRLGKVGLILFIGGMSLLLFSMFLAGIVVGKHMEAYPDHYAQGIVELIRDRWFAAAPKAGKTASPAAEQGTIDAQAGGEADFGLTFYDTLGGRKKGAVVESQTVTGKDTPPEIMADAGAKKSSEKSLGLPVPDAPSPKATEASGKGQFEVQAAAYREREKAEAMVGEFATLGFSPQVVMKDLPGKGRWFRVIVGGFENREKAQDAADKLAGKVRGLNCVIRPSGKNGNGG